MSPDAYIIVYAVSAFCVFVFLQAAAFRMIRQDDAIRWIMKLYCLVGAVLVLAASGDAVIALGSFMIFSGFSFVYVLCLFGPVEASLTLRILSEIYGSRPNGITEAGILRCYNKKIIVRRRINRLVKSGDLTRVREAYYRTGKLTAFSVREKIINLVNYTLRV
jgi:hypothetical protein